MEMVRMACTTRRRGIRPNDATRNTAQNRMENVVSDPQLRLLFHQLNNQLGIVLAHAELLEAKSHDVTHRARAEQVVRSVLDALGTAKEIRRRSEPDLAA